MTIVIHNSSFGFYLLGPRAYSVLESFVEEYGSACVVWVVCARDPGVANDFFTEIQALCMQHGIAFLDRAVSAEADQPVDLKFSIGWKWLIKQHVNLVVFHDSLLPRYRGFAPLVNALINGEPHVGVTAIRAGHDYDCGDVLGQVAIDICYPMSIAQALALTAAAYRELVLKIAQDFSRDGKLDGTPQCEHDASYSLWRGEHDYRLNWSKSSRVLKRFIDAVGHPFKGAAAMYGERLVRVTGAEVVNDVLVEDRDSHIGKTIFRRASDPVIVCGEGLLRLTRVTDDATGEPVAFPFRTRLH